MRSLLTFVSGLTLMISGCGHVEYEKYRERTEFEEQVKQELDQTPYFVQTAEYKDGLNECSPLKQKSNKRKACLQEFIETSKAQINISYSHTNREEVKDVFTARIKQYTKKDYEELKQIAKEKDMIVDQELQEASAQIMYYDLLSRKSHEFNKIRTLHSNHIESVSRYNEKVDQVNERRQQRWRDIAVQNQLNSIQQEQYRQNQRYINRQYPSTSNPDRVQVNQPY